MRVAAGLALLALTAGLAGCGTISNELDKVGAAMRTVQEPPAGAPHALMRISANGDVFVQPGRACDSAANPRGGLALTASSVYIGAAGIKDQMRGVTGGAPPGLSSGELRVAAGEPHVITYAIAWRDGDWMRGCRVARSFVPVEGAHYQAMSVSDRIAHRCGLLVMQLAPVPGLVETTDAPACPKP